MSWSATHVVVGATDPDATIAFFAAFGFAEEADSPGAAGGRFLTRGLGHRTEVVIREAPAGRRLANWDLGPRGLDIYTRDIDASVAIARDAGGDASPIGVVELGPMVMKQATVWGPDDLPLVLIENDHRRACLLDDHPGELHSEIHSLVWAVADRDAEAAWWTERGATQGMAFAFAEPAVSAFMRLPESPVELAMTMLANDANDPIRFELLEFPDRPGAPFAGVDLAGIQAIGFTLTASEAAAVTGVAEGAAPGSRVATPGGVALEIRTV